MDHSERRIEIRRADRGSLREAFAIVTQYYEALDIVEREELADFESHYFGEHSGFWLALDDGGAVGCVGLRELDLMPGSAEVKRLYVTPRYRNAGVAAGLMAALEAGAMALGYEWLYLDSNEEFREALRFYRKRGYSDCARYNGNQQATIFMRKRIAEAGTE